MNYEGARSVLAAAIESVLAAFPTLHVAWDNVDGIDFSKVGDLCLLVEFYWNDSAQINLSDTPAHRTTGSVYFTLFFKEGTGTRVALQLADVLTTSTKFKNLSGLVTTVVKPGQRSKRNGWRSQELHLPFYFDSTP